MARLHRSQAVARWVAEWYVAEIGRVFGNALQWQSERLLYKGLYGARKLQHEAHSCTLYGCISHLNIIHTDLCMYTHLYSIVSVGDFNI